MEGGVVPFHREAAAILEEWQAVQRELEALDPMSAEAETLRADAARLRNVYQRIVQQQRESGGSDLPPLPEPTTST
jgi:hypothetical protein